MSLVEELQREAADDRSPVSTLVRKAFVAARKLDLADFETWCRRELDGYKKASDTPDYRRVMGHLQVGDEVRGWTAVRVPSMFEETFNRHDLCEPVCEMETVLASFDENNRLHVLLNDKQQSLLSDFYNQRRGQFVLHLQPSAFAGVLGAVRDRILLWSLDLQRRGILGEGYSFCGEEKPASNNGMVINFGSEVRDSQVMIASPKGHQTRTDVEPVEAFRALGQFLASIDLEQIPLAAQDRARLVAEVATIVAQASSPAPRAGVITDSAAVVRRIVEGATSSVIGSQITQHLLMLGL